MVVLIDLLVRSGHRVEIRAVLRASYIAEIRDIFGEPVGNLEYRSALDEPEEQARGVSYASFDVDVERHPDRTFRLVQTALLQIEDPCVL